MGGRWRQALAVAVSVLLTGGTLVGTSTMAGAAVDNTGQQDPSFVPASLNGMVRSAIQLKVGDQAGKYLIGGQFADVGGDDGTDFVARLNPDGSRDTTFTPLVLNGPVWAVTELQVGAQAGKYLIGGEFSNSVSYRRVARLNAADGTQDTSFTPPTLNSEVRSVVELSDGKYLIGGDFSNTGYVRLARLNAADGTRDTSFTPPTLSQAVNSVAELTVGAQAGKYLIGGWFEDVDSDPGTDFVARLNGSDGSRDTSFTPLPLDTVVNSVAELSDGKYLVGGAFTNPGYAGVARLNAADGSRDTSFTPLSLTNGVLSVTLLTDGKYLIGGYFEDAGGDGSTDFVARLNGTDGTRDSTFAPLALNNFVQVVTELGDGKYLIGGQFSNTGYDRLARLGVTTAEPGFSATPSSVVFGAQGIHTASAAATVTVTNSGAADLVIGAGGVGIGGENASEFAVTGGTCVSGTAVTVQPAQHCTAVLTFTPSSAGVRTASLQFATNLPAATQTVALQGTGAVGPGGVSKPRRPRTVKVAGAPRASKFTASWAKPSTAGDRPVDGYTIVVRQRGVKKPAFRATVAGSRTSVRFTRKQLLKHSQPGVSSRGDVSTMLLYRVVVESVNAAGHSPAGKARFLVRP